MNRPRTAPRLTLTALGLSLALAACGPSGTPNPNGAPTADSLSTGTMSQLMLDTFAQTVTPELQTTLKRYASGKGFDEVGGPPLLGFLGGGVSGLSLNQIRAVQAQAVQQRQQLGAQSISVVGNDCTTVPGDQTDLDHDGILDQSKATYTCAGDAGFAYSYEGEWSMKDKTQDDGGASYLFTGNSLGKYSVQDNLIKYSWAYTEKSSLDTLQKAEGGSTGTYLYNWDARGSAGVLGVAATFDLKWRLNLTLERTPDAGGQGSSVEVGGKASAGNTQTSLGGSTTLAGTLHYSASCGGFDSGSLNYASGGSSHTLTYTACNVSQ